MNQYNDFNRFSTNFKPTPRRNPVYSAGILPYQIDENGKIYLLLGKDNDGAWSDFGGKCELKDQNNIKITASREFFEESLNSVIDINAARELLKEESKYILAKSKTLNGSPYYMFITRLPMRPEACRDRFKKTLEFLKYIIYTNPSENNKKWIEKTDIQWVSLDTILYCLDDPKNEQELGWPLRKVFKTTLQFNKAILLQLLTKNFN